MKKVSMYILVVVMFMLTVLIGVSGFTVAKYVAKSTWNYYLETKGFYFDSDDLNGNDNINNNWDGGHVYFSVKNSSNKDLVTGYDISYKATCRVIGEDNYRCLMNGTDTDTFNGTITSSSMCINEKDSVDVSEYGKSKCEEDGYTWINREASSELYFDVVSTNEEEITGLNVLVEVQSTSPYKKTLSSTFVLNKGNNLIGSLELDYNESELYNRLVVSNLYNENKCVKLSWDSSKLRIDVDKNSVSSFKSDDGYINEIVFNINRRDSQEYLFYKVDTSEVISNSFFTLIESNGC